jgi:ribosomal protein S18 acetylase RimI-like enzyme
MDNNFKRVPSPTKIKIRLAKHQDIPQLLLVENLCFDYDQLNRRSFKWIIERGHSFLVVAHCGKFLIGYGLVLLKKNSARARLYSLGVVPEFQGNGVASKLIRELEKLARLKKSSSLILEVKETNEGAIKFYTKLGYMQFKKKLGYYQDHSSALCFEKTLKKS